MAIEFNCPYCSATIRVPDSFAGRTGSCPKCRTKLLVPDVKPPPLPSPTDAASDAAQGAMPESRHPVPPPPSADAGLLPPSTPPASDEQAPVVPPPPAGVPEPAFSLADAVPPTTGETPPFPLSPEPTAVSSGAVGRSLRKRSRRRKSQRIYAVAIPLACFVVFVVVIGFLMFGRPKELKGTLAGSLAVDMEIPTATVSLTDFELSAAERSTVADAFAERPEAFVSDRLKCQVTSEASRLQIDLALNGDTTVWFAVNPTLDRNLQNWIRDYKVELNKLRLARLADVGTRLCRDKLNKAAGQPVVFDAPLYRDEFGFAAQVDAFGFAVEAVAGAQRAFCAHEDRRGILYFALPADTTEFTLRGRSLALPKPLFPGEYRVVVEKIPATMGEPSGSETGTPTDGSGSSEEPTENDPTGSDDPDESADPSGATHLSK